MTDVRYMMGGLIRLVADGDDIVIQMHNDRERRVKGVSLDQVERVFSAFIDDDGPRAIVDRIRRSYSGTQGSQV